MSLEQVADVFMSEGQPAIVMLLEEFQIVIN
jgi:hypothetical protein